MNAFSDSAYAIGSTHLVCQDYARSGEGFAIIGDGCSKSPDSDFGARLLVAAATSFVRKFPDLGERYWDSMIATAFVSSQTVGIRDVGLDATLLVVRLDDDAWKYSVWGDGQVIAKISGKNQIEVIEYIYADNFPFYLSYSLDGHRLKDYLDAGHGELTIRRTVLDSLTGEVVLPSEDQVVSSPRVTNWDRRERYEWMAVSSDGLGTFYKQVITDTSKTTSAIPIFDVIMRLMAFKGFTRGFVQRRMKRFLADCQKDGWMHSDDISLGVVHAGS